MSAEQIDQLLISTDPRTSAAEMEFAKSGEGTFAIRFRNARKMLDAFHRGGTPDEVVQELTLSPEEFDTAIDDAQSLHDGFALHVIPLRETPQCIEPAVEALETSDNGEPTLTIVPEHDLKPEMTKQQLVDAFSQLESHENPISFRRSLEGLLSLSKENSFSKVTEAATFLRDCLPVIVEHGTLDDGELPRELFTGDVLSNDERQRLFTLIGIKSSRNGRGQRIASIKNPVVLADIRKNAQSGRNSPDEAEANIVSALNAIAQRLGVSVNP